MLKSRRAFLVVGAVAEELLLEWLTHEFPSSIAAKHLRGDAIPDVPGIVGSVEVVLGGESDDVREVGAIIEHVGRVVVSVPRPHAHLAAQVCEGSVVHRRRPRNRAFGQWCPLELG
eukprot:507461-Rhodomonas_salina.3